MENLRPLLEKASKILNELENLGRSGIRGKLLENTKKGLVSRLDELSDRMISSSEIETTAPGIAPATITGARTLHPQRARAKDTSTGLVDQKTLREIRRRAKIRQKKRKKEAKVVKGKAEGEEIEIRKPNFYVQTANLFFKNFSNKMFQRGYLKELTMNIRKSGLNILVRSYVSMIFLNVVLGFIMGAFLGIFFSLFSVKLTLSLIPLSVKPISPTFLIFLKNLLIWPLLMASLTFLLSYYWPSLEASSRKNRIHEDLPFAIIHMSATAGSGVPPTKIFKLISETNEYREFSKEARRVVNKINLYGYDLTTALKESARISSSPKVKDLFNGMATTIATGGDLKLYLEKKAADAMMDYKLTRRKFAEAAGTYADVYTGILIAAPLIFGVMIAVMAPLGGKILGISFQSLSIIGLIGIFVLNIAFLFFMKIVQPAD